MGLGVDQKAYTLIASYAPGDAVRMLASGEVKWGSLSKEELATVDKVCDFLTNFNMAALMYAEPKNFDSSRHFSVEFDDLLAGYMATQLHFRDCIARGVPFSPLRVQMGEDWLGYGYLRVQCMFVPPYEDERNVQFIKRELVPKAFSLETNSSYRVLDEPFEISNAEEIKKLLNAALPSGNTEGIIVLRDWRLLAAYVNRHLLPNSNDHIVVNGALAQMLVDAGWLATTNELQLAKRDGQTAVVEVIEDSYA